MSNSNYIKGRRAEYRLKKELEAEGFLVARTAGSRSAWDLIAIPAMNDFPVRFYQVKSVQTNAQALRQMRKFFGVNRDFKNRVERIMVWVAREGWFT